MQVCFNDERKAPCLIVALDGAAAIKNLRGRDLLAHLLAELRPIPIADPDNLDLIARVRRQRAIDGFRHQGAHLQDRACWTNRRVRPFASSNSKVS